MTKRASVVSTCIIAVLLGALLSPGYSTGDDETPAPLDKAAPTLDLSQFPKLRGKVQHSVGGLDSFVKPEAGEMLHLDLKEITKLSTLVFDAEKNSYIPLPGPVVVESVNYYGNGAFQSMRLVSKKGDQSVTIDISPRPGLGPKRVLVWVVVERQVVEGVLMIDTEFEGTFPAKAK